MVNLRLDVSEEELERFCTRWSVAELALFGSVLREDFRAESDVDVLVTFEPDATWGLFDLVRMEDELQTIFHRDVDLVLRSAVERSDNYIRRESILNNCETVSSTSTLGSISR